MLHIRKSYGSHIYAADYDYSNIPINPIYYVRPSSWMVSVPSGSQIAVSPEINIKRAFLDDVGKNFKDLSLESLNYFLRTRSESSPRELSNIFQLSDAFDEIDFNDAMESAFDEFVETGSIDERVHNFKSVLYFAYASCETKNTAMWECSVRMFQKIMEAMKNQISKLEDDALKEELEKQAKAEQQRLALKAESDKAAQMVLELAVNAAKLGLSQTTMEEGLRIAMDRIDALELRLESRNLVATTDAAVASSSSSTSESAPPITPSCTSPISSDSDPFAKWDEGHCIRGNKGLAGNCCHHRKPCHTFSAEEEMCRSACILFEAAHMTYKRGVKGLWQWQSLMTDGGILAQSQSSVRAVRAAHSSLKDEFSAAFLLHAAEPISAPISQIILVEIASITNEADKIFASVGIPPV